MKKHLDDQNVWAEFSRDEYGRLWVTAGVRGEEDHAKMKVRPEHIERFPAAYEEFQRGEQGKEIEGTPLGELALLRDNPQRIQILKAMRIETVEQLAEMHDGQIDNISKYGGLQIRKAAREYLELQRAREKDDEMETLKARIAELEGAPPKRGRGRPPKVTPAEAEEAVA